MPKVKVNKELLLRVGANARLNLSSEEIKEFMPQLQEILNAFSKLDSLKVDKLRPSFQPLQLKNIAREDKIEKCLTQQQALLNTEHKKDGYFKGPRVVD